jgi:hypothetical protein
VQVAVKKLLIVLMFGSASARAGITVTSYSTLAETNGYALSLQGPYFAQQTLENVSPALAQISADWTGPNADGTPDTWHWVGASQANSITTFGANSYTVTAAGSVSCELNTTAEFVDPGPSVFSPGGAANHEGFFTLDTPATYSITAQLNLRGRVRLSSASGFVFNQINGTSIPQFVNLSGTIPSGEYLLVFAAGVGPPNFPNGVNHFSAEGSYRDVMFTVQVPEPAAVSSVILIFAASTRTRNRCGCAD